MESLKEDMQEKSAIAKMMYDGKRRHAAPTPRGGMRARKTKKRYWNPESVVL